MSLDEIKALTDIFGAGGGLLVMLGMLAVGALFPVWRRERQAPKPEADLVKDSDVLVFMARHELKMTEVERRVARLERKIGD